MSQYEIDRWGNKRWYNEKGSLHRIDNPAIEYANGEKEWYQNDRYHRENGPALEYADSNQWFINDKRHREDGPAVEYSNGYKAWYLNGKFIDCNSQEEFLKLIKLKAFW